MADTLCTDALTLIYSATQLGAKIEMLADKILQATTPEGMVTVWVYNSELLLWCFTSSAGL